MTFFRSIILTYAMGFVMAAVLTAAVRRIALRWHLVDQPCRGKGHVRATPYLGGIAIAASALVAPSIGDPLIERPILMLAGTGILIALLGLADDIWRLSVNARIAIECSGATVLIFADTHGGVVGLLPGTGQWLGVVVTVLWIVLMANSFNLLDNSDGAAGSVAMVTTAALAALALGTGWESMGIVQLALSAACAGFLVHNWPTARIFMGDSGSLFLGFVISASAVLIVARIGAPISSPWAARACGLLLLLFVAEVDTCTVIVSRKLARRSLLLGGTDHIAHRLHKLGLSGAQATALLAAVATLSSACGILVVLGVVPWLYTLSGALATGAAIVLLAQRVRCYGRSTRPYRPVVGGYVQGLPGARISSLMANDASQSELNTGSGA